MSPLASGSWLAGECPPRLFLSICLSLTLLNSSRQNDFGVARGAPLDDLRWLTRLRVIGSPTDIYVISVLCPETTPVACDAIGRVGTGRHTLNLVNTRRK